MDKSKILVNFFWRRHSSGLGAACAAWREVPFSRCSSVSPDGVTLVCASDAAIVFLVVHSFLLLGGYRSIDGKENGCG